MNSLAFNHATSKNIFLFVFLSATIVYIAGLFVDVINVDAAQYASISKEMFETGSYLVIKHCGEDYLDKPPLLFWLSALSFKIFGIYNWSYKLPSFLFSLIGVFATYKLALSLYDKRVATLAALILYTTQAIFMFNNDVRTDTLLAAAVITAIWLLHEYTINNKWIYLLGGSLFIALGMLAKGPIGLVAPALALGSHWLLKTDWQKILKWQWLFVIVIIMVLLTPMCYGLYKQFGFEGVKFFFWTQSFGRITGENVWKNDAGYFFFLHTFLWSFMPWSVVAIFAFSNSIWAFITRRTLPEYITLFGFTLVFIALSLSRYKLPHYIFVVFPLMAILTAEVIETQISRSRIITKWLVAIHLIIFVAYVILNAILFYIFPIENLWFPTIAVGFIFISAYLFYLKLFNGLVIPLALASIAFNFTMNTHFYPNLMQYQAAKQAATTIKNELPTHAEIYFYKNKSAAFDFYFKSDVKPIQQSEISQKAAQGNSFWIYSENPDFKQEFDALNISVKKQYEFDSYKVQLLKLSFLNPATRNETLNKAYLVEI